MSLAVILNNDHPSLKSVLTHDSPKVISDSPTSLNGSVFLHQVALRARACAVAEGDKDLLQNASDIIRYANYFDLA